MIRPGGPEVCPVCHVHHVADNPHRQDLTETRTVVLTEPDETAE